MEAVQLLQNPGILVSGKIAPSVAGQMGDGTALPIFDQMFAQAAAVVGTAEQSVVEPVLPQSVMPSVPVTDTAAFPSTGQIPSLLTVGGPAAMEITGGGDVESSETAWSTACGAGSEVPLMLAQSREKVGKIFVRKEYAPGKNPDKRGEAPAAQSEVEKKSVTTEPVTMEKHEATVELLDETGLPGRAISEKDEKSEASFDESGMAFIPVLTPDTITQPAIAKESRMPASGEVFQVPVRSAFAATVADIGNGDETLSSVNEEGMLISEPPAKATEPNKTGIAAFQKTGDMRAIADAAAPAERVVAADAAETNDPEVISFMEYDTAVRKLGRQDTGNPDMVNAAKVETVLRQVPSGVTLANPAQTVHMGKSAALTGMTMMPRQDGAGEAQPVNETDTAAAMVSEDRGAETGQAGIKKHASVSTAESDQQQNAGEGKVRTDVSVTISPSGTFETALRGRTETQPTTERTELHQSILSQVQEKLVSPEARTGASRITLKLNPRELGDMQIHLRMEDAKVSVEITAQNPVVREALVQNIDQLKETLSRQNIAMERFDVMTGNGQTSNQSFREGRQTAQPRFDNVRYPDTGYYQEESGKNTIAYGEAREDSLVDMRF
jgi:flagellar hook-length control protein FliK